MLLKGLKTLSKQQSIYLLGCPHFYKLVARILIGFSCFLRNDNDGDVTPTNNGEVQKIKVNYFVNIIFTVGFVHIL